DLRIMGHSARNLNPRVSDIDDALDVASHRSSAFAGVAVAQFVKPQSLRAATPEEHLANHRVLLAELLAIELAVGQIIVEVVLPPARRMEALANQLLVTDRD